MALPEFESLWKYDQPAATEQAFRELLPQAEAAGNLGYHAELLTQIARTHSLRSSFDEAHGVLDQVEELLQGAADPSESAIRRARARSLLERGRTFNSSGKPDESRPLFLEAWRLSEEVGADFHAVDALHMLGIVSSPTDAVRWNLKAMERAEASEDPRARGWLGALLNNLGWTFHDREEYPRALEMFEKSLAFWEEKQKPKQVRIARWSVARTWRSLDRVAEALATQQELLAGLEAAGETDGYVLEEIAECLLALDRPEDARPFFARAHTELAKDPWLKANQAARLERLERLGSDAP